MFEFLSFGILLFCANVLFYFAGKICLMKHKRIQEEYCKNVVFFLKKFISRLEAWIFNGYK